MPFLKAKKIREEKEKEKNIQTAEPVEISVSEPEPIQEPKSEQTVTDNVDENPGEKIEEIEKGNKTDREPESKEEEITKENSDSNAEDEKNENQTSNVQVVEEVPGISEDSTPEENENPDGQGTFGDGGDNAGGTEGGESTGQDGDRTSGTGSIGGTGSSTGGGTSDDGEIEDKYDFDSNERYVDKVSTKTEFDKVLDSLAAISKDLLSHEVERFAKKYADKYQGNFTKAEADAKKYEAFLGGYITNAAMTLYDNNYREAAIRQLEQAKSVLIARQRLEEETSAIKERVEEEGAAVDLSDILGMFGDG